LTDFQCRCQVFAGDKYGNIALWDATEAGKTPVAEENDTKPTSIRGPAVKKEVKDEDDGEEGANEEEEAEEEEEAGPSRGKFWLWRAHQKNSVSCLKFRPHETKKVSARTKSQSISRAFGADVKPLVEKLRSTRLATI
jgi:hypothetical protein